MTDDPLGFPTKESSLLNVFEAVFFVLSTVGIGTPTVDPVQQQLSDEHLFWK